MSAQSAADWLVVGAGFTGATVARVLAERYGQRVLVVDRRPHLAGNAFDEPGASGLLVHRYGPHIFHTNSDAIWAFVSRFTAWRGYEHRVLAAVDGHLVPLPFGFAAIDRLFGARAMPIKDALLARFGPGARVPVLSLRDEAAPLLADLGHFVYEQVFRGYTRKHWGCAPEDLDPSVTARVPILVGGDDRYFQDRYQAIPANGYTALFRRLLDHPGITVTLKTDHRQLGAAERALPTVYTGPLDEFFDRSEGALPYRTVAFEFETLPGAALRQPAGTVNFPGPGPFTRSTEQRWLTGQPADSTVLIHERPGLHQPGVTEPFYPVPAPASAATAQHYRRLAADWNGRVWFAGRLGDYRYYNMDQACARGMSLVEKQLAPWLKAR